MIQISESAQSHFRRLIEREALPGLGVRLSAMHPGTPRADVRLEFAEPADLLADFSWEPLRANHLDRALKPDDPTTPQWLAEALG